MTTSSPISTSAAARFGTFKGVFTPNVLTILGIILFLRTGWVVGQAGLWGALAIILLANAISFITGLSLSAIATSMDVKAGGNYYLISRSLGLEIGGAIGIPLYFSQAISVAFYIIGFTEAMMSVPYVGALDPRLVSTAVAFVFVLIAYVGADFALRIQYFILAILVAALISFFTGGWGDFVEPNLMPRFTEGISFWIVFAVFFPAVTGIEIGVSMSGDLKNPSRSIPRGTIASIAVTALVYVAAAVWFAFQLSADTLISVNLAMEEVASVPILILAGVAASTLSSALGSVLAAPRTLQAISRDRVVPSWLASEMGSPTEPRAAVLITGIVAVFVIWMGNLNFVAPIITMFFLNTYGMVNLVAGIERLVGNPSFRPRFRVPTIVSLLGGFGCYGAMFLINIPATIVAIIASYGIFLWLSRRNMVLTFGDMRSGIWTSLARYALLNLERRPPSHGRNWRPNIVVFTGQPHNREYLVQLAEWLTVGRGIVTFMQLITGPLDRMNIPALRARAQKHIRAYIKSRRMAAFAEAHAVENFPEGSVSVVQSHGIGVLDSNTILMGWSDTPAGRTTLMEVLQQMSQLRKSVLFLRVDPERGYGVGEAIDIWWGGRGGNADLMLLLGHVISRHGDWAGAELRLSRIIEQEPGREQTRAHMKSLLEEVRVDATPRIIVRPHGRPISELLSDYSTDADLSILGMQIPESDDAELYGERLNELVEAVGTVLLVYSAQPQDDLLAS